MRRAAGSRGRPVRPIAEWRFGVYVDGSPEVLAGDAASPSELVEALGRRAGHRPRREVARPRSRRALAHDTEVAAYLLEPARRAYPFRELTEERGLGTDVEDEAAADALLLRALADWQREEIRGRGADRSVRGRRAPARAGPARDGARSAPSSTPTGSTRSPIGSRPRPTRSSARSSICAARSSRSARPSSSRRSCSAGWACRASGAARPATRPTRACSRRFATSTR